MSKPRFTTRQLTTAAIIAAVYTALTTLLPIPQYGGVQLRVAEAMTVLPFFPFPWTGSSAPPPRCLQPCGPAGCPTSIWLPCRR